MFLWEVYMRSTALLGGSGANLPFPKQTLHACLPGQYASTSSFWAEVRVGEPSSDSGIRGLSTNFAFLRGAKDKKRKEGREESRKEERWEKGKRNRGKGKRKGKERNTEGSWVRGAAGNRWKHLNERHTLSDSDQVTLGFEPEKKKINCIPHTGDGSCLKVTEKGKN